MIRYQLRCSRGHGFEGWFKNSEAYAGDVQALDCPVCGDRTIEKAIMAPAVLQRGPRAGPAAPPETSTTAESGAAEVGAAASGQPPAAPSGETPAAADAGKPMASVPAAAVPAEQARLAQTMQLMRKLRAHVEAHFEPVGPRFAEEARKIHYNEAEPRGIYGEATAEEVRRLEDEGIEIAPLPRLPKLDG